MVTHIPTHNRSNTSLPLSPPLSTTSSSRYEPTSAASRRDHDGYPRRTKTKHSGSAISNSSQSTLIAPPSFAESAYPLSPPASIVSSSYAPSTTSTQAHHRAPSISSYASSSTTRHSRASERPKHGHAPHDRERDRRQSRSRSQSQSQSQSQHKLEPEPVAQLTANVFPWFEQSGDVEIVIRDRRRRAEKRYLLHSLMLSQNSSWFANDLKDSSNGGRSMWGGGEVLGGTTMARMEEGDLHARNGSQLSESEPSTRQQRPVYEPAWASDPHGERNAPSWNHSNVQRKRRWYYELNWSGLSDDDENMPILFQTEPSLSSPVDAQERLPRPPAPSASTKPPPTSFFRSMVSSISGRRSSTDSSSRRRGSFSSSTDPPPSQQPKQPSLSSEEADLFAAYDNLFLCFYNHAPQLSTSDIATAYLESKLLLTLACAYSAQQTVGQRVDHHLLGFGNRLWKQIAKYPPSYLKLGYLAHSRAIFAEALTHVVGQWPAGEVQLKRPTSGIKSLILLDIVEDKVEELEQLKLRVEVKLFRLNLTTSRGQRVSPNSSYLDWLAVSLFRQWIADATAPAVTSILKPGRQAGDDELLAGGDSEGHRRGLESEKARNRDATKKQSLSFYTSIASTAHDAYLGHDEVKRFLKTARPPGWSSSDIAGNRDIVRRFERRLDELKNLAREAVRPLTRHALQLDEGERRFGYLVGVRCGERDFQYVWRA